LSSFDVPPVGIGVAAISALQSRLLSCAFMSRHIFAFSERLKGPAPIPLIVKGSWAPAELRAGATGGSHCSNVGSSSGGGGISSGEGGISGGGGGPPLLVGAVLADAPFLVGAVLLGGIDAVERLDPPDIGAVAERRLEPDPKFVAALAPLATVLAPAAAAPAVPPVSAAAPPFIAAFVIPATDPTADSPCRIAPAIARK
jgi:hypothetical protein